MPPDEDPIWFRPERARRDGPSLSRERITRAAIALADSEGLEAVSIRRLAAKLGAGATSLYWYVDRKEDLHELMADAVVGEVQLPAPSGDWPADVRVLAHNTVAVLRRHSWLLLLGIQPGLGPQTQGYGEAALALLDGLGLELATRINIIAAINNYLYGFVHREAAWKRLKQRSGADEEQWRRPVQRLMHGSAPGSGVESRLTRHQLWAEPSLEFGLDCLIDGIAARLSPTSVGTPGSTGQASPGLA